MPIYPDVGLLGVNVHIGCPSAELIKCSAVGCSISVLNLWYKNPCTLKYKCVYVGRLLEKYNMPAYLTLPQLCEFF